MGKGGNQSSGADGWGKIHRSQYWALPRTPGGGNPVGNRTGRPRRRPFGESRRRGHSSLMALPESASPARCSGIVRLTDSGHHDTRAEARVSSLPAPSTFVAAGLAATRGCSATLVPIACAAALVSSKHSTIRDLQFVGPLPDNGYPRQNRAIVTTPPGKNCTILPGARPVRQ